MLTPSSAAEKSAPGWLLWPRRLLALALLAGSLWLAWRFPVAHDWLSGGLAIYALLLLIWPSAWLLVLPAALPALDLSPWSGRLFFTEFDLLLTVTTASLLWQRQPLLRDLPIRRSAGWVVGLWLAWQLFTTINGLWPLQVPTAQDWVSYLSPYNALRLAKGFAFGLLLLPLLHQARQRGNDVNRLAGFGLLAGILTGTLGVLWDRALFIGVWDFDHPYRATGMFGSMHVGGAPIDAWLTLSLPFVFLLLFIGRWRWGLLAATLFGPLALYSLYVTFSRADYPAVGVSLAILAFGWLALQRDAARLVRRHWLATGSTLGVIAIGTTLLLGGGYIQQRFTNSVADLGGRLGHWGEALSLLDSPQKQWLGIGKGAFPRQRYALRAAQDNPQRNFEWRQDADGPYLRLTQARNDSEKLDLRQRVELTRPGRYRLQVRLRNPEPGQQRLLFEFCQRNILLPDTACNWTAFDTTEAAGQWIDYNRPIDLRPPEQHWYGAAPFEVSLLHRGLYRAIDIGRIQLYDPDGRPLLQNPEFRQGLDHWFYAFGDHLAWHVKSIWIELAVEGGLIGLALFMAVLLLLLAQLRRRMIYRDGMAPVLAAALAGVLMVGLFDSLVTFPRISWLLLLLIWLILLPPMPQQQIVDSGPSRLGQTLADLLRWAFNLPRPIRALGVLLALLGAGLVITELAERRYQLSPTQLAMRAGDKLGIGGESVARLIAPPDRYPAHRLDGRIRRDGPRILLPQLAGWDGRSRPTLFVERERRWSKRELRDFGNGCRSGGITGLAACYLQTGDEGIAQRLTELLKSDYLALPWRHGSNYGNGWQLALGYDAARQWPGLSAADRQIIEQRLRQALQHTLVLLDGDSASLWHGRATLAAQGWLAAVVLDPDDTTNAELQRRAQAHLLDVFRALATSEAWPEGYNYWINSRAFWLALAGNAYVNGLEDAEQAELVRKALRRTGHWMLNAVRPDGRIEGIGDEGPRTDGKDETRRVIDLIARLTRDRDLAAYSAWLGRRFGAESYYRDYRWGFRLFNDPTLEPTPLPDNDLSRIQRQAALFGPGAMNQAYLHNGHGREQTFISFRAGHSFTHHGHYDAGHFSLFKGAPLAANGSNYGGFFANNRINYGLRTVAKNSLLILRPGETVPIRKHADDVADGGQRLTQPTGSAITSLDHWRDNLGRGLHLEGGKLTHFAHADNDYSYLSADLTAAYNSSAFDDNNEGGKVEQVLRELLYLRDEDVLLVRDRVRSTRPDYTKKWLLHTIARPQVESERLLTGKPDNGISETTDRQIRVHNGDGRLLIQRLLPVDAVTRLVGGPDYRYYVEADGDDSDLDGENFADGANPRPWFDNPEWRIELQPAKPALDDEFLILLAPGLAQQRSLDAGLLPASGDIGRALRIGSRLVGLARDTTDGELSLDLAPDSRRLLLLGLPRQALVELVNGADSRSQTSDYFGVLSTTLPAGWRGTMTVRWHGR